MTSSSSKPIGVLPDVNSSTRPANLYTDRYTSIYDVAHGEGADAPRRSWRAHAHLERSVRAVLLRGNQRHGCRTNRDQGVSIQTHALPTLSEQDSLGGGVPAPAPARSR